ncbi:MAG: hypothetical protein AAF667_17715 [Pseudomonadota bacterium]
MTRLARALLVGLAFVAHAACSEPHSIPAPNRVLTGTDVMTLSSFRRTDLPADLTGTYVAETGGALLTIQIAEGSASAFGLERRAAEPGESPDVATYRALRVAGGLSNAAGSFRVVASDEGLLVWEADPESAVVPADFWVLYRPER